MRMIIDIPDTMVQDLKDGCFGVKHNIYELAGAICDGVEIPNGCGRLIDEREAIGIIAEGKAGKAYFGTTCQDWEVIDFLKTVPTVIGEAQGDAG